MALAEWFQWLGAQADYWTIELATGKSTRLTNDTYGKVSALWSPDGSYIYYSALVFSQAVDVSG